MTHYAALCISKTLEQERHAIDAVLLSTFGDAELRFGVRAPGGWVLERRSRTSWDYAPAIRDANKGLQQQAQGGQQASQKSGYTCTTQNGAAWSNSSADTVEHHSKREEKMGLSDLALLVTANPIKLQNLRGQSLLFRCLETGFVTTAPALGRYQRGRGIDPSRRDLVGERPLNWVKEVPTTVCEHCGMVVRGTQWTFRQHQQSKRCQRVQSELRYPSR
jgi:hypothetical protein